jgi:hypothetical protein
MHTLEMGEKAPNVFHKRVSWYMNFISGYSHFQFPRNYRQNLLTNHGELEYYQHQQDDMK